MANVSNSSTYELEQVFIPGKFTIRIILAVPIGFLNLLASIVFATMKKKTFSNALFLSSTLSDMMVSLVQTPLEIISSCYPLSPAMCFLTTFMTGYNFEVTNDTLLILTLHRFLLVVRPVKQTEKLTRIKYMVVFTPWIFQNDNWCYQDLYSCLVESL